MRKLILSLAVLALVAADASACGRGRLGGRFRERVADRRAARFVSVESAGVSVGACGVSAYAPAATVTASATVAPAAPKLMPVPQQVPPQAPTLP